MYSKLTIIIPAYNEESLIAETIRGCYRHLPGSHIIVVDDGSSDATKLHVELLYGIYPTLSLISNNKRLGYGGAVKTGFNAVTTEYIGFLDADKTYPPEYLPVLLNLLEKHGLDCAWGNRFAKGKNNNMPFIRKYANRLFAVVFSGLYGVHVPDLCSGMRVFTKKALEKIDYPTLPDGLDMITAMSKRTLTRGLRYDFVPISVHKRNGHSKLRPIFDSIKMVISAIKEK